MNRNYKIVEQGLALWQERYSREMLPIASEVTLRRDMITLLQFVSDNKVVGTQSTGNMPLKMIRAVTAQFVNPPVLDHEIGGKMRKLRTEDDVWPLYYLHVLAEVGDLLITKPSRIWRLTKIGEDYLEADALSQIQYLLRVWWYRVNWAIAYPYTGMGDAPPDFFNYHVLDSLISLKPNLKISFEKFANEIIERTGMVWGAQDSEHVDIILQGAIERMVIGILVNFGAIETEYKEKPLGAGTIPKLSTFKITPFGRVLLEALAVLSQ
ncbi:MAG: hypothetical protein MAG431_00522 [Chloroflexi bacterium]|nr:hypothetical protein [Chloroflexota bacterium]